MRALVGLDSRGMSSAAVRLVQDRVRTGMGSTPASSGMMWAPAPTSVSSVSFNWLSRSHHTHTHTHTHSLSLSLFPFPFSYIFPLLPRAFAFPSGSRTCHGSQELPLELTSVDLPPALHYASIISGRATGTQQSTGPQHHYTINYVIKQSTVTSIRSGRKRVTVSSGFIGM
jgi:hypothetical protein